ncbi:MAG: Gfo/Idh/MocA family oxidoreductase [Thermoproteales archaeon]|nr:Gfo/Idh/MocA family oxidoreductase [Thermoproteales archaeon]
MSFIIWRCGFDTGQPTRTFIKTPWDLFLAIANIQNNFNLLFQKFLVINLNNSVNFAIVGAGRRSKSYLRLIDSFSDRASLVAVCDPLDNVLKWWRKNFPDIRTFKNYQKMLDAEGFDSVIITSPLFVHAEQAIQALERDYNVLSEVPASYTLEEAWRLVDAAKNSNALYMMNENYCYMRYNMMVLNMVTQGVFGEITYAEGGYIHDVRHLKLTESGKLTWRGKLAKICGGNPYPTHATGPVSLWSGINRTDKIVQLTGFMSKHRSLAKYVEENFGSEHPGSKEDFWKLGDSTLTVLVTESGVLINIRVDTSSARPHNMTHYHLQGTEASYISSRYRGEKALIWINGRSPGKSPGDASWENLEKYIDEFEHPKWKRFRKLAIEFGHGGGDFLGFLDFLNGILNNEKPMIDVYDAVTWSALTPLSIKSIEKGNKPIEFPDFKK